jgi:mannose-1-phosphate guanylyltransferase
MIPVAAIVLCAGLGTRLSPLTDRVPKPMLDFLDRPMASWALDALARLGVRRVGINRHHHPQQVLAWMDVERARHPDLTLVGAQETALLGTGGGARGVWQALGCPEGDLVVINGDIVADLPLQAMLQTHRRTGATATLLTVPRLPSETGLQVDVTGSFLCSLPAPGGMEARSPDRRGVHEVSFSGVYVLHSRVLAQLPEGSGCLIRHGLAPRLTAGETLAAHAHGGFWADLGTPRRFVEASLALLRDPGGWPGAGLEPILQGPRARTSGPVLHRPGDDMASPAWVDLQADIQGPCFVGPGARIEAGARIHGGAVIGRGCVVRSGAQVSRAVLMRGAVVERTCSEAVLLGATLARAV